MTRTKYWAILISIPVAIGLISNYIAYTSSSQQAQAFMWQALCYHILLCIPVTYFFRMRHLGFTWKEMLVSLVPFIGAKYRSKALFDPK
ncbi:hypothetical protein Q0590_22775 [Rhodocytophaga aerolata]|uniref:Uncharacterized protein n=1 Tax=Rhodocytophaga aerolata TaxID=455078 RepID=A0ABT8RAT7_9BACT|nr:hypothetical protein [Rhodocytophaga aerolata]MDO1449119.1 hypothetical protein [Rhodocytophaga aerolata]